METRTVKIDWLHSGKKHAYGDSYYEAKVELIKDGRPDYQNEKSVAPILKAMVKNWAEKGEWYEGKLEFLKPIPVGDRPSWVKGTDTNIWHLCVRYAYTD